MSYLFVNIPLPDADDLAAMQRWVVGRVLMIGESTFTTTIFSGDDWATFATEGDFQTSCDSAVNTWAAANAAKIATSAYVMVDIENDVSARFWTKAPPDGTGPPTATDISRFVYLIQKVAEVSGLPSGFYNFPERNWYTPVLGIQENIDAWFALDDLYQDVIDASGVLFPSVYLIVDNLTVQNLQAYGRYMAHNTLRMAAASGSKKQCIPVTTWNGPTGSLVTGATWATFIPALFLATELDPAGQSGTAQIDGIQVWTGGAATPSELNYTFKYHSLYSPKAQPKAFV